MSAADRVPDGAGYMGATCHRPCQDIYLSCTRWDRESRCENMRTRTDFFDVNCAVTCGVCEYKVVRPLGRDR